MVDLVAHCSPPATILSEGGATWGLVLPFLVILGPSSCSSSATVWVSYEVDLEGLALLWLWVDPEGTWTVKLGTPAQTIFSEFCLSRPANALVWVWPCPLSGRTGNLRSWRPVLDPVLTSPCSPANLVLIRELPRSVYAGDKFGGTWLSPTRRLSTGGFLYPPVRPWLWPLWTPLWIPWVLWTGQRVGLWTGRTNPGRGNFLEWLWIGMWKFVYLGFNVAFNTVQVISRRVVGRAEETST